MTLTHLSLFGCLVLASGCSSMSGTPSLTVIAAGPPPGYDVDDEVVTETGCTDWAAVLFVFSDESSHESLTHRVLERTGADLLVDTRYEVSGGGFPYVFVRQCTTVSGRPARKRDVVATNGGAR